MQKSIETRGNLYTELEISVDRSGLNILFESKL